MPTISESKEAGLRRIIRDIMALDPIISMNGLQRAIQNKTGKPIDEVYLKKLVKKVTGEMAVIADREKVEERVMYLRERNRILCDELFRIAFPSPTLIPQPDFVDRRKAIEAISMIENRQVKLEMDLGIFTRQIGTINVDHRLKPIDEKTLEGIVATFKAWSTPPQMRKIEAREVVRAVPTHITNEPPNQQPSPAPVPARPAPAIIPTSTGTGMVTA